MEATVELLAAEVRVLMVGSRQVTLSVARQLDEADDYEIEPFGRIRTGRKLPFAADDMIEVIGSANGTLARSVALRERYRCQSRSDLAEHLIAGVEFIAMRCAEHRDRAPDREHTWYGWLGNDGVAAAWRTLPLIVLAGLR